MTNRQSGFFIEQSKHASKVHENAAMKGGRKKREIKLSVWKLKKRSWNTIWIAAPSYEIVIKGALRIVLFL